MSAFNEQDSLEQTMQSILNQQNVNLELIVVNDGSTDKTGEILNLCAAKNDRVKIINQENQGITQALINGCKHANGTFIARQDAGDWSLPGRLKKQRDVLTEHTEASLCSTGSRYFSERGELLFEANLTKEEAENGIKADTLNGIKGPAHHGCTMFRRTTYEQSGGYRASFSVAQDLDLWTRLANFGNHIALPEMYYEAVLRKGAISSKQRKAQEITRKHIYECTQLRKQTGSDVVHVDQLQDKILNLGSQKADGDLEYNYFVGSVLLKTKPHDSRYYFKEILISKPWHLKSVGKLILSYF